MGRKIAGGVTVEVDAKTGRFNRGMSAAEKSLGQFGKRSKLALSGVRKQAQQLERDFGKLTRKFGGFTSLIGGVSLAGGIAGLVSVNREVEKLTASLETVTGSGSSAERAFDMIKDFTATTPFQINQVAEAFIKLKSLGLDPSEAALRSYGNTASAMGKSLDQMIEAIADATTGEFERLKEFGIRASSIGDNVEFTFQGVTTTIGKNAIEIEEYLRGIGDIQFAGAMEKQMETLDGSISNMKDSFFTLGATIGEAGFSDLLRDMTTGIADLSKQITLFIENPASMPEWLKVTTFAVKAAVLEFKDLGDWIGAVGAIMAAVASLDFNAIDNIIAARKEKRAEMEAELTGFVAMLEGFDERIKTIQSGAGLDNEDEDGEPKAMQKITPVMSEEEFDNEFARAEQQFDKLNKLYDKKAKEQQKLEQRHSAKIVNMKMNVAQQAIGLIKMVASDSKAVRIGILAAEKGLAIAQTIIQTQVAQMRALAELGPIAGPPAAATIGTLGAISVGLIAATGLAQASSMGGGGGTGVGGVPVSDTVASAPAAPPTILDEAVATPAETTPVPGEVNIFIEAGIRDENNIIELVQKINELAGDGLEVKATVLT